jgi:hypothetical protein
MRARPLLQRASHPAHSKCGGPRSNANAGGGTARKDPGTRAEGDVRLEADGARHVTAASSILASAEVGKAKPVVDDAADAGGGLANNS